MLFSAKRSKQKKKHKKKGEKKVSQVDWRTLLPSMTQWLPSQPPSHRLPHVGAPIKSTSYVRNCEFILGAFEIAECRKLWRIAIEMGSTGRGWGGGSGCEPLDYRSVSPTMSLQDEHPPLIDFKLDLSGGRPRDTKIANRYKYANKVYLPSKKK